MLRPKPPTSLLYHREKSSRRANKYVRNLSIHSRAGEHFPDVLLLQPLSAHRWILFYPRRPWEINTSSSNVMENSDEAVYKCITIPCVKIAFVELMYSKLLICLRRKDARQ